MTSLLPRNRLSGLSDMNDPFFSTIPSVFPTEVMQGIFNRQDDALDKLIGSFNGFFDKVDCGVPQNVFVHKDEDGQVTQYVMEFAFAGYRKEDLTITHRNNQLVIHAEREEDILPENVSCVKRKIRARKLDYSLTLNSDCDAENITSKYTDGILTVTIPVGASQSHTIEIQ